MTKSDGRISGMVRPRHSVCTLAASVSTRSWNWPRRLAEMVTVSPIAFMRSATVRIIPSAGRMMWICAC